MRRCDYDVSSDCVTKCDMEAPCCLLVDVKKLLHYDTASLVSLSLSHAESHCYPSRLLLLRGGDHPNGESKRRATATADRLIHNEDIDDRLHHSR
jgi:hypothetical protein